MSKTNVNPNDFIMRQAKKQADMEKRASDASRRLGPPSRKASFDDDAEMRPAVGGSARPSKPRFVSTTVWIEEDTLARARKIVFDRKAAGEGGTLKEFINRAIADAVEAEERGL